LISVRACVSAELPDSLDEFPESAAGGLAGCPGHAGSVRVRWPARV